MVKRAQAAQELAQRRREAAALAPATRSHPPPPAPPRPSSDRAAGDPEASPITTDDSAHAVVSGTGSASPVAGGVSRGEVPASLSDDRSAREVVRGVQRRQSCPFLGAPNCAVVAIGPTGPHARHTSPPCMGENRSFAPRLSGIALRHAPDSGAVVLNKDMRAFGTAEGHLVASTYVWRIDVPSLGEAIVQKRVDGSR
jgi:hypothetical protein